MHGVGRVIPRRLGARLLVVAALGITSAASGCAGDDDDGVASDSGNSAAKAVEPVTLAMGAHTMTFAPAYIAKQAGYFEEEGLDVEFATLQGGAAVNAALASGEVFVGWGGGIDIVGAAANGQPVRLVGLAVNRLGNVLAMSKEFIERSGVPADAPLEDRIAALRGAKIASGAAGTGGYIYMSQLLSEYGLDPENDVTLVGLGTDPSAQATALEKGSVDGTVLTPPTVNIIVHAGTGVAYINPLTDELPERFQPLTNNAVVASVDGLENPEKRATIEAMFRATTKATQIIHDDPDQAVELLKQEFPDLDPAVVESAFEMLSKNYPDDASPTEEMTSAAIAFLQADGQDVPDMPFDEVADPAPATSAYESIAGR